MDGRCGCGAAGQSRARQRSAFITVPVVFLYYTDYLYAQSHTLQGFRVAPVNDPPQRFWNIEDWYVKTVVRQ